MDPEKNHWEKIYQTKKPEQVSWTQDVPSTSLDFIHSFELPKTARIIDIGGGDSRLADFLLDEGFINITVLDISGNALDRARERPGHRAGQIKWVEQDVTAFPPDTTFDLWHDRAAFHFLTTKEHIITYLSIARHSVKANGYTVIETFSDKGPDHCSGLPIKQYTEGTLTDQLHPGFRKIKCITEDHITAFHTRQNFLFCSFRRN